MSKFWLNRNDLKEVDNEEDREMLSSLRWVQLTQKLAVKNLCKNKQERKFKLVEGTKTSRSKGNA